MCQNDLSTSAPILSTRDPGLRLLAVLFVGVPLFLLTPLAGLVPVPGRLLLGFIWLALPIGCFLAGQVNFRHKFSLKTPSDWGVAGLLGWSSVSVLMLIGMLLPLGWLGIGILFALGNAACIWGLRSVRNKERESLTPEAKRLSVLVFIVTVLALAYLARMGGFMSQDGYYHLAYIKELVERGWPGSAHPFLSSTEFDPRYAVSSYHNLLAFVAVFCGVSHLDVWFYLPCIWVILGVGVWILFGEEILGSRSRGYLCAVFFVLLALLGSPVKRSLGFHELRTLAYPGGYALHVLIPALCVVSWTAERRSLRTLVLAAAVALTLASTHLFYCLLGLFVLAAGWCGVAVLPGNREKAWSLGLSLVVAGAVSFPLFAWGWIHYSGVENPVFRFDPASTAPHDYKTHLLRTGAESFILHPKTWLTRTGLNAYVTNAPAIGLLFLVLFWRKIPKEPRAFFAGIVAILLFVVSVPPLFVVVTDKITIYKSFRLYQVLPVVPLLAVGVGGLRDWALRFRSKVAGQSEGKSASPWLAAGMCLVLTWIAVPDLFLRVRLLESGWESVHSWWQEPRRDISRVRFNAIRRLGGLHESGTLLADPFDSMAYAAFYGGKVVAIPDYHASPTSTDIDERLDMVNAVRTGWFNTCELSECLSRYEVGSVLVAADRLSPVAEAALSMVFEDQFKIPVNPDSPVKSVAEIQHWDDNYLRGYSVFVRRRRFEDFPEPVFIDVALVDEQVLRLQRDGVLWGASNEIVTSVKSFLSNDTTERFARWQGDWVFATRSRRLIRENGSEIPLHSWREAPGRGEERPIAIIESQDGQDLFLFGSRGSVWSTRPERGEHFDTAPAWGRELIRGACRDPKGGIFLLGAYGGIHVLGDVMRLPADRPSWGTDEEHIDMTSDLALDSEDGSLYLLTRTGEVFRLHSQSGSGPRVESQTVEPSIWLAIVCNRDSVVAMDYRGRTSRLQFDLQEP